MLQPNKEVDHIKLIEMTNRDVGLSLSVDTVINLEKLTIELAHAVQYLIDKDFEKLMQILYRIDVSETKVKQAFGLERDVAVQIAELIIGREQQKVISREKYK